MTRLLRTTKDIVKLSPADCERWAAEIVLDGVLGEQLRLDAIDSVDSVRNSGSMAKVAHGRLLAWRTTSVGSALVDPPSSILV